MHKKAQTILTFILAVVGIVVALSIVAGIRSGSLTKTLSLQTQTRFGGALEFDRSNPWCAVAEADKLSREQGSQLDPNHNQQVNQREGIAVRASDVNNDGKPDLIVSEPGYLAPGEISESPQGRVTIRLSPLPKVIREEFTRTGDPFFGGPSYNYINFNFGDYKRVGNGGAGTFGSSIAYGGDLTGDGIPDLAIGWEEAYAFRWIGSPRQPSCCRNANGLVAVIPGPFEQGYSCPNIMTCAKYIIVGDYDNDKIGASVAMGDFNRDGFTDLFIGSRNGILERDDTNGDGVPDFRDIDGDGHVEGTAVTGLGFVYYGKAGGLFTSSDDVIYPGDNANQIEVLARKEATTKGVILYGNDAWDSKYSPTGPPVENDNHNDQFFTSASTGDIDGDGFDDLFIGSPGADTKVDTNGDGAQDTVRNQVGEIGVIPGSALPASGTYDVKDFESFVIVGPTAGHELGLDVSLADISSPSGAPDGKPDLLVTTRGGTDSSGRSLNGVAYLAFGPITPDKVRPVGYGDLWKPRTTPLPILDLLDLYYIGYKGTLTGCGEQKIVTTIQGVAGGDLFGDGKPSVWIGATDYEDDTVYPLGHPLYNLDGDSNTNEKYCAEVWSNGREAINNWGVVMGIPGPHVPPCPVILPIIIDTDADSIADDTDNCIYTQNADQSDIDADGVGDVCDNCVMSSNSGQVDSDSDSLGDSCDNCPIISNLEQSDLDSDGIGSACDSQECGNEIVEGTEACDGNSQPCTTFNGYTGTQQCSFQCSSFETCTSTQFCGDGIVNGNEQCDDGNGIDTDSCSNACVIGDSDGDGVPDSKDQCQLAQGKAEYNGCPYGDLTHVDLHYICENKEDPLCADASGRKGSRKEPLAGAEVRVFDRNNPQFQGLWTKNPKGTQYGQVFEAGVGMLSKCFTDNTGECHAGEKTTGDYLVIAKWNSPLGHYYNGRPKGTPDFLDTDGNGVGDLATKYMQFIIYISAAGQWTIQAGSSKTVSGSFLNIEYPLFTIWDGTTELLPIIFTSDSAWAVDACMTMPQGYTGGTCQQEFVSGETKWLLFTATATASPEPNFRADIKAKDPKGRVHPFGVDIAGVRSPKFYEAKARAGQRSPK